MVEQDNIEKKEELTKPAQEETKEKREKNGANDANGKFKSDDALKTSYMELQAKFTKKCQELKEVKKLLQEREEREKAKADDPEKTVEEKTVKEEKSDEQAIERKAEPNALDKETKERAVREYLALVAEKKVPLMGSGGAIVTSEKRSPRTLREASQLALQYLKGNSGLEY